MKKQTILSIVFLSVLLISTALFGMISEDNEFDYCEDGRVYKHTFDIIPEYESYEQAMFYEKIYYNMDKECYLNGR